MSIRKGNTLIAGNAAFGYRPPLLQSFWSDHILNRPDLSRADTFSWQSGKMYKAVYKELVSEYDNENSVEETEGEITFKRTPKGYKIADKSQEQAILDKYNTDGIAWYYILDKDNTQFKLPRTKFGFEGVRDSVGNDIQAGLPNITGSLSQMWANSIASEGATIKTEEGTSTKPSKGSNNSYRVTLDASLSSSIYGKSDTVQEHATQMYLYFYVGNYTQSAIEQTAGLNSELFNNKADKPEVDGGWVGRPSAIVAESVTPSSTDDIVYDISNILPNDNYLYEVYLAGQVQTNATSGNIVSLIVGSSIIPSGLYVTLINTRTSSVVYSSGCAILPIGVDRTLFIGKTRNTTGKIIDLKIVAYRRLGKTN